MASGLRALGRASGLLGGFRAPAGLASVGLAATATSSASLPAATAAGLQLQSTRSSCAPSTMRARTWRAPTQGLCRGGTAQAGVYLGLRHPLCADGRGSLASRQWPRTGRAGLCGKEGFYAAGGWHIGKEGVDIKLPKEQTFVMLLRRFRVSRTLLKEATRALGCGCSMLMRSLRSHQAPGRQVARVLCQAIALHRRHRLPGHPEEPPGGAAARDPPPMPEGYLHTPVCAQGAP